LILINSDFKRISWILVAGVVILAGHYIDFFNMVMPGTVGDRWFIGVRDCFRNVLSWFIYLCCVYGIGNILATKKRKSKHFHY
jgi:hypothetical protein